MAAVYTSKEVLAAFVSGVVLTATMLTATFDVSARTRLDEGFALRREGRALQQTEQASKSDPVALGSGPTLTSSAGGGAWASTLLRKVDKKNHDTLKSSWLTVPKFLFPLDERGYIQLNNAVRRIAFDIGTAATSLSFRGLPRRVNENKNWVGDHPGWVVNGRGADLHVIMVEPNYYSSTSISLMADPAFVNRLSDRMKTWGGCIDLACNEEWFNSTLTHFSQWHMINAAASFEEGFATFWPGNYENVGTGSLFQGTSTKSDAKTHRILPQKLTPVPVIAIAALMAYMPPELPIEVIKIDAQGADAGIVMGIPHTQLKRVKCIVGEFRTRGYTVHKSEAHPNFRRHLVRAGFVGRYVAGNQVFYNKAFADSFASGEPNYCFTWDVPEDSSQTIAKFINDSADHDH